jgi:hypothetical protein
MTIYRVTCPLCRVGMERREERAIVESYDSERDMEAEDCEQRWAVVLYVCPKCELGAHVEEDREHGADIQEQAEEFDMLEADTESGALVPKIPPTSSGLIYVGGGTYSVNLPPGFAIGGTTTIRYTR